MEAKQYSKEIAKGESLPPKPMKGRTSPNAPMSQHMHSSNLKTFGSNKHSYTIGDENLDYTLECMQRQDRIMGNHKRAEIMDSTDEDLADEFDGIDEMKVRGIDRTVMATKKINKPTNKALFLPSSSKGSLVQSPSFISNHRQQLTDHSSSMARDRPGWSGVGNATVDGKLSSSRNLYPSSNKSSIHPNDRIYDNIHPKLERQSSKFKKQLGNGIVEQLIFCISNDHETDAFSFQAQVHDIHKKIKKVIQIGFLEVQTDTNALSHVCQILNNFDSVSDSLTGKADLVTDGFWWVFSRNIIMKLKLEEFENNQSSLNYKEENISLEDEHHNVSYTPADAIRSQPYSSRDFKYNKKQKVFNSLSFTELYNIFVNKLDKTIFEDFDIFYQIDSKGAEFKLNNNNTYAGNILVCFIPINFHYFRA